MSEKKYGFQICTISMRPSEAFRIFSVSKLNNLKIMLTGRDEKDQLQILLEDEGDEFEIYQKFEQKLQNLKLYINLYFGDHLEIKARSSPEIFAKKEYRDKRLSHTLDIIQNEKNFSSYLDKKYSQQHTLLETALNELRKGDIFNAFPKLVNWLDDNDKKGASRFCCIRDASSHGKLEQNRALKILTEKFPDEFEIEEDILKRNSQQNKDRMNHYLPEVLEHVKRIFKEKYID